MKKKCRVFWKIEAYSKKKGSLWWAPKLKSWLKNDSEIKSSSSDSRHFYKFNANIKAKNHADILKKENPDYEVTLYRFSKCKDGYNITEWNIS